MNIKRIGLDPAKQTFQLHAVDHYERVVLLKTLRRSQMLTFFIRPEPSLIGIEACGSSHYWAARLQTAKKARLRIPILDSFARRNLRSG